MGILKTGKATVWTVLASFFVAVFLLGYSLSSVSADWHGDNDHDNNHGHFHATPTPTPRHNDHDNHNDHDDHNGHNDHNRHNDHDNHNDHDDHNGSHNYNTPTPTPTTSPDPEVTPEVTPDPPVYDGKGDGLGCAVHDCSGNATAEDYGVGGQVLGAATMADTGTFAENLYLAIMLFGAGLTFFGHKSLSKSSR